jgi:hypothetical protein
MSRYYRRRSAGNADRFNNYTTISARFDSVGSCGHPIKADDRIGYNAGAKKTQCPDCWGRWQGENQEAQQYEDRLAMSGGW